MFLRSFNASSRGEEAPKACAAREAKRTGLRLVASTAPRPKGLFKFGLRLNHVILGVIGFGLMCISPKLAAEDEPKRLAAAEPGAIPGGQEIQLRGRVVCLAEEMHRLFQADLPTQHEHLYGFRTDEGKFYTLLRGRYAEALFADERFRSKELLIKGRTFPGTQLLEAMSVRSVRDGRVYDLYYYCDVCEIRTTAPEICACCQGPMELLEKPLSKAE